MTVTNIAQRILDSYGHSMPSTTITEYLIDDAIDEINTECGTSIADLTGTAGSKSLAGTEDEIAAVKLLAAVKLRDRNSKGRNLSIGPISQGAPSTDFLVNQYRVAVGNLKAPPIHVENDPLPNE